MSYYRIGERNARKLVERDHPLIKFGTPSDTLLPVRLTPEALEHFGGQPLFDTALAETIVGSHYPLYREPESHHAPFRLEQTGRARVTLRFAYNTNGAANHRLDDAIDLIKGAGYDGVALTLDIHHLDPFAEGWATEGRAGGEPPGEAGARLGDRDGRPLPARSTRQTRADAGHRRRLGPSAPRRLPQARRRYRRDAAIRGGLVPGPGCRSPASIGPRRRAG